MTLLGFVTAGLLISLVSADQNEIFLNGDDWTVSDEAGRVKEMPATVPGIVHTDLVRNKVIGDPYYGFNDVKLQWIAFSNWVYTLHFKLSSDDTKGKVLMLKCDGLDTAANISLNDVPVGFANNYHRRWLFDITKSAKEGDNVLNVRIEAAGNYSVRQANNYPYTIDGSSRYIGDVQRNYIRKTQSDFGWDWGPAFIPAGIWQNISIVSFDNVYVSTIVPKSFFDKESQSYMIEVLVCAEMASQDNSMISVSLTVPKTPFESDTHWTFTVNKTGETCSRMVTNPVKSSDMDQYLWRPYSSSSRSPLLYDAKVTVSVGGGRPTNSRFRQRTPADAATMSVTRRIGFRNIEINQDPPPDKSGLLFYFQQSDSKGSYPIYSKGSNVIPMDAFVNRATPEVARRLLQSAVLGNQNMIRVWGGGLYQPNWFYDICDELGIMVWQEFMFGDAQYPRDKAFLANVKEEVIYTVRRLGYHPSIVLWSGNNENQGGAQASTVRLIDYSVLYDGVIRATLWDEDTTRPYWPSSPSNGASVDDKEMGLYIQRWGDSRDSNYGDTHRYDYTSLCTDVTKFPRPRFASEFGFQSYPSFASLRRISEPSDWDNNSTFMNHRQHHPNGNEQLANMMKKFFHLPFNSNKTIQFQDFVYLTQVVQSICITAEAEHYRRILNGTGYTRGTLYWQLNDIWQAQTWASIEYAGRWKLLHYGLKKVFQEVLVSAYELDEDIGVYVVNDQPGTTIKYDFKASTVKWSDGSIVKTFTNNTLTGKGFSGVRVFNEKISDVFAGTSTTESFLHITVTETGTGALLSEEFFFPSSFANISLPHAKITLTDITSSGDDASTIKFTLSSDVVAPFVYLDSGDIEGYFSDNGMLLMPGTKYDMTFTSWQALTVENFKSNITTRSIRDTY